MTRRTEVHVRCNCCSAFYVRTLGGPDEPGWSTVTYPEGSGIPPEDRCPKHRLLQSMPASAEDSAGWLALGHRTRLDLACRLIDSLGLSDASMPVTVVGAGGLMERPMVKMVEVMRSLRGWLDHLNDSTAL